MCLSSQTKKQSVKVPPMSTEMRFIEVVSLLAVHSAVVSCGAGFGVFARPVGDRCLRIDSAFEPFRAEGIDVPDHVDRRRMSRRQVLRLDLSSAAGAVELQNPAEVGVRGERELVLVGVDDRLVDLARITVVDERALLVIASAPAEFVSQAAHTP